MEARLTNKNNFGKLPPQAIELEEAILGAILIAKVPQGVFNEIRPEFFYKDAHQKIYQVILQLRNEKTPIDILTVTAKLRKMGELEMIGGAYYITELTNRVASAANIEYHIRIVHQAFLKREIIRYSSEAVQQGYDDTSDVFEVLSYTLKELSNLKNNIFKRTEKRADQLIFEAIEEMNRPKPKGLLGISTGLRGVDYITQGNQEGQLIIDAARPAMGKALWNNSSVLSEKGFIKNDKIKIGDSIFGSNGELQKVIGVYPQGKKQLYKVIFSDETTAICSDDHLWLTYSRKERKNHLNPTVKSLNEIRNSLNTNSDNRRNHSINYVDPIKFSKKELLINPYLLGILLGDSHLKTLRISNPEIDILEKVKALFDKKEVVVSNYKERCLTYTLKNKKLKESLKIYNLENCKSDTKFIPGDFLKSDVNDRVQLLRGLIDTDGFIANKTSIEYTTVSQKLRDGIIDLVRSLGGRVTFKKHNGIYKKNGINIICKSYYRMNISFSNDIIPVSSQKHLLKYKGSNRNLPKYISEVKKFKVDNCICIEVSNPNHLYITNDYIVTHNTAKMCSEIINCCFDSVTMEPLPVPTPVACFSLEMRAVQLTFRMVSNMSEIDNLKIKKNQLTDQEELRFHEFAERFGEAPIFIDDTPGLTIDEFETKASILVALHGVKEIYIDYLQLMKGERGKKYGNRDAEIGDITRRLKTTANELAITIIVLCQLNREVEKRKFCMPTLSDLRESGSIEQDADVVRFLWRPEYYPEVMAELNGPQGKINIDIFNFDITNYQGLIICIIAKCREERTGKIPLRFKGNIMRVSDHPLVIDRLKEMETDMFNQLQVTKTHLFKK